MCHHQKDHTAGIMDNKYEYSTSTISENKAKIYDFDQLRESQIWRGI